MTTDKITDRAMARPYFSYSGQQLIELFENCGNDREILKALKVELKERKTTGKMGELRERVSAALKAETSASLANAVSDSPRKKAIQASLPGLFHVGAAAPSSTATQAKASSGDRAHEPLNGGQNAGAPKSANFGEVGKMRPCGKVDGAPAPWSVPEKREFELQLPAQAPRIVRYAVAIRALIKEMRKKGSGMRTVTLEGGQAVMLDGREHGYRFAFDGEAELFEGARVSLSLGSRKVDGRIVAVSNKLLTISTDVDLGPTIGACVLTIDNTAMVEALADRLEKISGGEVKLDLGIAEDVVDNTGDGQTAGSLDPKYGYIGEQRLNQKQQDAVAHILANRVTYLWGPPGTGKTVCLSVATQALFDGGKKILICSNTNQAVDQVLLKVCKTLGTTHPAMKDGKILRLGQVHHNELRSDWSEWVTLDGIVGRKSEALKARKALLEDEIERFRKRAKNAAHVLERFKALDVLEFRHNEMLKRQKAAETAFREAIDASRDGALKLAELEHELTRWASAGLLRRILLRSEQDIKSDVGKAQRAIGDADRRASEYQAQLGSPDLARQRAETADALEGLKRELRNANRPAAQKEVDEAEDNIQPRNREIAEINRQLEAIEKSIVAEARIVGATVTKTYLSPQLFGNFDVVIVDEASMVLLPAIYYACALAKEKVVISGDFRQLSPIVPTDQMAILDVVGKDIFHAAGIEDAFRKNNKLKRTVMLEEQHRMTPGICDLISSKMYDRRLKTSSKLETAKAAPPAPFDREITIVDTSPIQPFVNKHGSSRYNIMHALTVRNLARNLRESGFVSDAKRLGICTPFAAQKEVLQRVLKGVDPEGKIEVGTVHRYQGDEKLAMVIDIPDSIGQPYVGIFAQAENPDDDGCKLFNVAVSRAKGHVIFVANLDYLDRKLPAQAFLREILHTVQSKGRVVDVRQVLAMWPIEDELRSLGRPLSLSADALRSGLFRQKDFDVVCVGDMEAAKKSIAIFSGFVTPTRVAVYEGMFRRKLSEGVSIRCVTRPPNRNGSIPQDQGREALDGLEAMGCIVDTRWDIHEKVVIIDDEIVWFGSLNPLSVTGATDEMMARFSGRPAALQLSAFMSVSGGVSPEKAAGLSVKQENPRCPDCGRRTVYCTGKHGPYWQCESDCGWKENANRGARREPSANVPKQGPKCPLCGSPTALRAGRFGDFYGCSKYPKCEGTTQLKQDKHKERGKAKKQPSTQSESC